MTMVARSIGAADISAFVDIPTPPAVKKSPLALIGQLELTGCQVLTNVGSLGMGLALPAVMTQRKEMKTMKSQHLFGSRAFHRRAGSAQQRGSSGRYSLEVLLNRVQRRVTALLCAVCCYGKQFPPDPRRKVWNFPTLFVSRWFPHSDLV